MNSTFEILFARMPTLPPPQVVSSRVDPVALAVVIAVCLVLAIVLYCILKRCCKKMCHRPKPTLNQQIMKKLGVQKSSPPFSVSGMMANREKK